MIDFLILNVKTHIGVGLTLFVSFICVCKFSSIQSEVNFAPTILICVFTLPSFDLS